MIIVEKFQIFMVKLSFIDEEQQCPTQDRQDICMLLGKKKKDL